MASFVPPESAPAELKAAGLEVEVHYQLYQGLPMLTKSIHYRHTNSASKCRVNYLETELLAVNHPWSPVPLTAYSTQGVDHYYSAPRLNQFDGAGKLHVEVSSKSLVRHLIIVVSTGDPGIRHKCPMG